MRSVWCVLWVVVNLEVLRSCVVWRWWRRLILLTFWSQNKILLNWNTFSLLTLIPTIRTHLHHTTKILIQVPRTTSTGNTGEYTLIIYLFIYLSLNEKALRLQYMVAPFKRRSTTSYENKQTKFSSVFVIFAECYWTYPETKNNKYNSLLIYLLK